MQRRSRGSATLPRHTRGHAETPEDDYNLVMNTNLASFFFITQQVIPQMKKQNSGRVVNISAVLADQPSGSAPALLAVLSKLTMPALSKALALSRGGKQRNPASLHRYRLAWNTMN